MNTREKFRYMAFGGALVFLGMVGAMMSPLTAEKDKFGEIECTRLTVVDVNGKTGVIISSNNEHGGSVAAYGKDGQLAAWLDVDEHGGVVGTNGKDGKSGASLGVDENGGRLDAVGKDGLSGAWLGITEHGGHVQVNGKGDGKAVMGLNEFGNGAVSTWDKNGYRQ